MRYSNSILAGILLISAVLRLWAIGDVPASPDWDEVSLGYNAYSILHTGGDEYGETIPILFRSFDDYKPGLYVYLALPFIALGGLTVELVRLPSVIVGTFLVLGVYFIVKELFVVTRQKENKHKKDYLDEMIVQVALISAAAMGISPWHIQFSRVAFEASVGMACTVFGTLFFLRGIRNYKYWYLTAVFYSLAVYVYQSEKVFVPLLCTILILIFWRELWKLRRKLSGPVIAFLLIVGPFYYQTLAIPDALIRARGVSLFADQTPFLEKSVERLVYDRETGNILGLLFDNRRISYAIGFVQGYISHFDINWLFITGDEARHNPPGFGHLYLFELPFLLAGIYVSITSSISRKMKWLIFMWLLISPIPASITSGTPHPIRTIHFLPGIHILSAFGFYRVFMRIGEFKMVWKWSTVGLLGIVGLFNFVYFLEQYFVQYNYASSQAWQYGYEEALDFIMTVQDNYDEIVVSSEQPLDQSYMFFLFYTKYDPRKYQLEGGTYSGGFGQENKFDKFVFRHIDWEREKVSARVLYVGRPQDIDGGTIKTIHYLDGTPAIVMGVK